MSGVVAKNKASIFTAHEFAEHVFLNNGYVLPPNQLLKITEVDSRLFEAFPKISWPDFTARFTRLFSEILNVKEICVDHLDIPMGSRLINLTHHPKEGYFTIRPIAHEMRFTVRPKDCETMFNFFTENVEGQEAVYRFPPGQRVILRDIDQGEYDTAWRASEYNKVPFSKFFTQFLTGKIRRGFTMTLHEGGGSLFVGTAVDHLSGVHIASDKVLIIRVKRFPGDTDPKLASRLDELRARLAPHRARQTTAVPAAQEREQKGGSRCLEVLKWVAAVAACLAIGILFGVVMAFTPRIL